MRTKTGSARSIAFCTSASPTRLPAASMISNGENKCSADSIARVKSTTSKRHQAVIPAPSHPSNRHKEQRQRPRTSRNVEENGNHCGFESVLQRRFDPPPRRATRVCDRNFLEPILTRRTILRLHYDRTRASAAPRALPSTVARATFAERNAHRTPSVATDPQWSHCGRAPAVNQPALTQVDHKYAHRPQRTWQRKWKINPLLQIQPFIYI